MFYLCVGYLCEEDLLIVFAFTSHKKHKSLSDLFALWFRKCWTFLDRKHNLFFYRLRLSCFQCSDINVCLDGAEPQKIGFKGIITIPKPVQFKSSIKECPQVSLVGGFLKITLGIQMSLLQQEFTCSLPISSPRCASEIIFEGKTNPWFLLSPLFRMFPSWRPLCLRCDSSSCAAALWCCVCKRTTPGSARWPSVCSRCGSSALRRRSTGWSSTPRPNRQWVSTNKPLGV